MNILENLNDSQREAVLQTEGPLMIIAGAGSGKTTVLTRRLAYILQEKKADPYQILALTFTNKAAKEMKERIEKMAGPEAKNIWMGTFHSIFAKILRFESTNIGYSSNFTIYDQEDAQSLIKSIIRELKFDEKTFKPNAVSFLISKAKNNLVDPDEYRAKYVQDEITEVASKVYYIYEDRLVKANAMDFDDLLIKPLILFKNHPEILQKYQNRFKYIMVDEYQDTNYAQYMITKQLAAKHVNLAIVGDDAQSIYAFRGANIENILSFQKDYPDCKIIKLELNYRSTSTIVDAANDIIAKNKNQIKKKVYTTNETGDKIKIIEGLNEQEEAQKIATAIREQKQIFSFQNRDFVVLYRTNAQSRAIEDSLRRAGLTYKIFGGLSFYKRKEIKDVLAYLKLAINPYDEEAIKRVINYPTRGIGVSTIERLVEIATANDMKLWDVILKIKTLDNSRFAPTVHSFGMMIQTFANYASTDSAFDTVNYITKNSGILKDLHVVNDSESIARWENVQELINAAKEFTDKQENTDKSLAAFMAEVSLFTDLEQEGEDPGNYISLMTIHSAKGLEFNSVFITGLEENLFPSMMAMNSRAEIEEERRLFYVAVTRAKKKLTLCFANSRYKFGKITPGEKSRFMDEVGSDYLEPDSMLKRGGLISLNQPGFLNNQPRKLIKISELNSTPSENFQGDDLTNLTVGSKVAHPKFGNGEVIELEGTGGDARATVTFKAFGQKVLILKYAKMKIIE